MHNTPDADAEFLREVADHAGDLEPYCDESQIARIREIAARLYASLPIAVDERPVAGDYLCYGESRKGRKEWHKAHYPGGDFLWKTIPAQILIRNVTHYMPLPPPPTTAK